MNKCLPLLAIFITITITACTDEGDTPSSSDTRSATVDAASGGTLELLDGTRLVVPPGAVANGITIHMNQISDVEIPDGAIPVGALVRIDLNEATLAVPARLELPYNPAELPSGASEDQVFVAYRDDDSGVWTAVGGFVDTDRHVIAVELTHASTWSPWTWIADAVIQGVVTGFKFDFASVFDAFGAFDGCVVSERYVVFDESDAEDYIGTCVEVDDIDRPRIRIVNRRTFSIDLESVGSIPVELTSAKGLSRLRTSSFDADFTDASPNDSVTIRATVNWDATLADILLDVVTLLPFVNPADIATKLVVLIDESERCLAAAQALREGSGVFSTELGACLAEIAPELAELLGVAPAGLFAVLAGITGAGGIAIQIEDAAASARRGAGEVKYYSSRIAEPARPTQQAGLTDDKADVEALVMRLFELTKAKDWRAVYDYFEPRLRASCSYEQYLTQAPAVLSGFDLSGYEISDLTVTVQGDTATATHNVVVGGQIVRTVSAVRYVRENGKWFVAAENGQSC